MQQTIDVTADAANIDAGTQLYTFSGYLQTPVDNQTDQGRFIVEYLSATNVVLGTSYTSPWQSCFDGSGTGWNFYTNTRLAPVTTRKIRIRLQAELIFNRYAINVYFDDISLTRPSVVPVRLVSFTGIESGAFVNLEWKTAAETGLDRYELERSVDGVNFSRIATITAGHSLYGYIDNINSINANLFYYRLKMVDTDGKFAYSDILRVKFKTTTISIMPNPAQNRIRVSGTSAKGMIEITNAAGSKLLAITSITSITEINIAAYPAGVYFVRYSNGSGSVVKKLVVQ